MRETVWMLDIKMWEKKKISHADYILVGKATAAEQIAMECLSSDKCYAEKSCRMRDTDILRRG